MCASTLAVPGVDVRAGDASRLKGVAASGLATAAIGLVGFGLIHALIITPIWSQLLGGLPLVVVSGMALAWAYDQLPDRARRRTLLSGLQFGLVMMATLLPATLIDSGLRIAGWRRGDAIETAVAVALAAAAGTVAGWRWTKRRSAIVAFAVAAVALLLTTHGPLPVAQSPKGLWLSLAIATLPVLAGTAIAATNQMFRTDAP